MAAVMIEHTDKCSSAQLQGVAPVFARSNWNRLGGCKLSSAPLLTTDLAWGLGAACAKRASSAASCSSDRFTDGTRAQMASGRHGILFQKNGRSFTDGCRSGPTGFGACSRHVNRVNACCAGKLESHRSLKGCYVLKCNRCR